MIQKFTSTVNKAEINRQCVMIKWISHGALRSRLEILIITEYVISNNRKRINWYSQLF